VETVNPVKRASGQESAFRPCHRLPGSYPQKMRSLAMSDESVVSRHRRPMFAMLSRVLRQHQCYRLLEVSHGVSR
jgi:hypothetical protein